MTGVALLGAGRMSQVHAAATVNAGARVAVIFDPVRAAAEALAARVGAKVAATAADAMGDNSVDAIIIATSSETHVDLVLEAVRIGKPVLCEKPLASNLEAARSCIATIGEAAARRVFLGFNPLRPRPRRPPGGGARRRDRPVGAAQHNKPRPFPPPLEYIPRSGGLFRDMMIHDFDMARAITRQDFTSITAHGSSIVDPEIGRLGDIDTAAVTMLATDGTIVTMLNSRRCAFGFDQRIEAFGSSGMVVSDNPRQSGLTRYPKAAPGTPAPILEFFMERYGESYAAEIRLFLACAREGRDMPVNAIDGLMAAYLAEAATVSRKHGRIISLTGPDQGLGDA
jgi:myo-inositol 2-dehydrogenase / D-chiro-inositol 1-dehydrogenase